MSVKNKVLIVTTNKYWPGISRLPNGLTRAGFEVYSLCPKGSFLSFSNFLKKGFFYTTYTYSRSKLFYVLVLTTIFKVKPDLIVPGDEESVLVLMKLRRFCARLGFLNLAYQALDRSLADMNFDELVLSKGHFMQLCADLNIETPMNIRVYSKEDVIKASQKIGFPVVLKVDSGYGGSGVYICANEQELIEHYQKEKKVSALKKIKSFIKDTFFITIFSQELGISVQKFLELRRGHCSFAAIDGELLANNPMLTLASHPGKTGPTSVSQSLPCSLTEQSASLIVKKLRYNGFGSFDYMIDEVNQKIYFIELNARPTPWAHYSGEIVTHDLPVLLFQKLNHKMLQKNEQKHFQIALYPNELKRDAHSEFLKTAFHDIPVNDERLKKALES